MAASERAFALVTLLSLAGCQLVGGFEEFERARPGAGASGASGATSQGGAAGQAGQTAQAGQAGEAPGGAASGGAAGQPCVAPAAGKGSPMVAVRALDGSCFAIDETEVSVAQYEEFVAAVGAGGVPGYANDACRDNASFSVSACLSANKVSYQTPPSHPVTCVDWCDADAYCHWAGKALCRGSFTSSTSTTWHLACTSQGAHASPGDSAACNTASLTKDGCGAAGCPTFAVAALASCKTDEGAVSMVGNAAEWVNECERVVDGNDKCRVRGGSFESVEAICDQLATRTRLDAKPSIGFRCCSADGG